jgi:transcriptional regulator with XRE-family HTH domain
MAADSDLLRAVVNRAIQFQQTHHVSQRKLASAISMDESNFSKWLRGKVGISAGSLAMLLDLMNNPSKLTNFSTTRIEHSQSYVNL